jgi:O-antigen/teichoic acid export membrane protein
MIVARSLKANVLFYLAGTAIYALSQWLLVIMYARADGPTGVGLFAMASAISAPLIVLSQMSMRQVLIADVGKRFSFRDYLTARWTLSTVAVAATIVVAVIIGYRGSALMTVAAFATGRAFESISDIFYGRSQAHGGLGRVALYTGVRGVVTLLATGGVMLATHSMVASAFAFAAASVICQMMVRVVEGRLFTDEGSTRARLSRALLLHSAPLAISLFLISLTAYAPRLTLQHFGGERLVGQASTVEYFLSLGLLGVAALGQASSSPIANAYHSGDRAAFVRLVTIIALAAAAMGVGIVLAAYLIGRQAILALYGPSFTEAASAATAIIAGGAFSYLASMLGFALSATGRYDRMIGWSVAVLAVTIAGSYTMVGIFGLTGLGYALAASGLVNILGYLLLLRQACRRMPTGAAEDSPARRLAHG